MKLVVLFLVAVCCCSLGCAAFNTRERRKLQEVLRELSDVKKSLQHNELMLNSPPLNVENCCCLPALECFHSNLVVHLNGTNRIHRKFNKSLNSTLTKSGVKFCPSGNNTTPCHECASDPKVDVEEFFKRLESLIHQALSRQV